MSNQVTLIYCNDTVHTWFGCFSKSTLKELEEYASGLLASQKADFDSINKNDGGILKGMQQIIFQKAQSYISMMFDLVS